MSLIEEMANGNVEVLGELQDKMAEDFVLNLDYRTTFNGEAGFSHDEIKQTLLGVLDELDNLDTSLEIGEGSTLSDDALDSMQEMLDTGQVTYEELQKMMRMKGYEMEITGWKEVPGATSRVV